MADPGLRNRGAQTAPIPTNEKVPPHGEDEHPAGKAKHGGAKQVLRSVLFVLYFALCTISMSITQFVGVPLYFINQDYYYAWMSMTKQSFGLYITNLCEWWSPTTIRVSWDPSLEGQFKVAKDGRLETAFPERLVLIANHQLYTDWLYCWWIAYTSNLHGHIYIILKESLKYIPVIGPGMMFYGFIFLARNWVKDKPRFAHRLQKLTTRHSGPLSGSQPLDPMWLLMFPEGTNLSPNARSSSSKWALKQGIPDFEHQLIPRTTGLLYCLQELKGTVDWVYDCTLAYEGIPYGQLSGFGEFSANLQIRRGQYGQDIFTLRSSLIEGRPPKSVSMHWRRFEISKIPLDDPKQFEQWLMLRWKEKDALLETYAQTGRFPAVPSLSKADGFIETEVRQNHWWEFIKIFVVTIGLFVFGVGARKVWLKLV